MAKESATGSEQGEDLPIADEHVDYAYDVKDENSFPPKDHKLTALQVHEVMTFGASGQRAHTMALEFQCEGMDPTWDD